MPGLNISDKNCEDFEPVAAHCDAEHLLVTLASGMVVSTPLWWYPRLLAASTEHRLTVELSPSGVHRPLIDEDQEVEAVLQGLRSPGAVRPPAQAAE